MTSRDNRIETRREPVRLYLVTPEVAEPAEFSGALAAALDAGEVAAVLLRLSAADDRTLINRTKVLVPMVQAKGAALLMAGHAEIAAHAGADGAHLTGIEALNAAFGTLKPARIAGCGGLMSRHDAMLAAEAGADYVMFGEPDARNRRPSFDAVLDRVVWWAEVFEIPCVGFAATMQEAADLAAAGADFVAAGDCIFADARGPAEAMRDIAGRLACAEPVG
jgi:thiamine-phosphate pyrophosphorylase